MASKIEIFKSPLSGLAKTDYIDIYADPEDGHLKQVDESGVVTDLTEGDRKVSVSGNDIAPNDLESKLVSGRGIAVSVLSEGGDEKLEVSITGATDAVLVDRINHTGTQTASTISDFDAAVSASPDIAANTAKVSADGSVTTHNDITSAGSGDIITSVERNKLIGIDEGATSNSTDATLLNRVNHTGTQLATTISDFDVSVVNNAAVLANTAKVTASGSVTDHNDVISAGSGQIITAAERTNILDNTLYRSVGHIPLSEKGAPLGVGELDGSGKLLLTQVPISVIGGLKVVGTWDASTNTPDLSLLTQNQGEAYQVSVAGSTDINGETNWRQKDLVAWDDNLAGNWYKLDNTDDVISVNNKTGAVVINPDDLDDSATTNKFVTQSIINSIALNIVHRGSDGSDHTFINQDVTTAASPTFAGLTVDTDTIVVDKVNNRVGIGTTTPIEKLVVVGYFDQYNSINTVLRLSAEADNPSAIANGFGAGLDFHAQRGSNGNGGRTGRIASYLVSGAQNLSDRWGMQFSVRDDDLYRTAMTILNTGRVGIGTTAPDQKLSVNGNASKSGGGSWATFSDARLKDIHGKYERGLDEVLRIEAISYNYKKDNAKDIADTETEFHGFIAQELKKVIPEAVSEDVYGYLSVNNDPIILAMLNAIKELSAQNKELSQRLEKIEKLLTITQE